MYRATDTKLDRDVALALLITLARLDRFAAWSVVPYVQYLVYANVWGYGVWRANMGVAA